MPGRSRASPIISRYSFYPTLVAVADAGAVIRNLDRASAKCADLVVVHGGGITSNLEDKAGQRGIPVMKAAA